MDGYDEQHWLEVKKIITEFLGTTDLKVDLPRLTLAVEFYVRRRVIKTASARVLNRPGNPETPIPVVV